MSDERFQQQAAAREASLLSKAEVMSRQVVGKDYAVRVDARTVVRGNIIDCRVGRVRKHWTAGGNLCIEIIFAVMIGKPGFPAQGPFFVKSLPR